MYPLILIVFLSSGITKYKETNFYFCLGTDAKIPRVVFFYLVNITKVTFYQETEW